MNRLNLDYKVKKIISQKDIDLKIIDKKKLIKIAEEYCQGVASRHTCKSKTNRATPNTRHS